MSSWRRLAITALCTGAGVAMLTLPVAFFGAYALEGWVNRRYRDMETSL